jgi:mRNA-degrading endonuclease RelE of RelBE toxin-antitoxin system
MTLDIESFGYGVVYSDEAKAEKRDLDNDIKIHLIDIVDQLSEDPKQFPDHTRELRRNLNIFLYRHPDPDIEITFEIDEKLNRIIILHIAAPKFKMSKPLFISYSHNDEKWMKELKKFLKPLADNDLVDVWDDTRIKPGENWREKIENALKEARLAVLLVSQDFLNSEFISNNELPRLLQAAENNGVKILWISVGSSTVNDTPIAQYQALHKHPPLETLTGPEVNAKLLSIYEEIKSAVSN